MDNNYNNLRQMKVGNKYTFFAFNYQGTPYYMHMVLRELRSISFERWSDAYEMYYRKAINNAKWQLKLYPGKDFILWDGYVVPDAQIEAATYTKDSDGGSVKLLKMWRPYDPRYSARALLSIDNPPLVKNVKPIKDKEVLLDFITVIS